MSLIKMLEYVSENIKLKNPFFQQVNPIAIKLKTGQIVAYTTEGEFTYCGIEDNKNKAFYIRIDPTIATQLATRQFSSIGRFVESTVTGTLVAYSFNGDKFNSILLGNKLREELSMLKFNTYKGGKENSIKIQVDKILIQEHEVFQTETGKPYEGGNTEFSAIAVTFKLKYTTSEDRCFEDCDVFSKYLCNN